MAQFNMVEQLVEDLGDGVHELKAAGHTLQIFLSNAAPDVAADAVKADVAEITQENGYTGPEDVQNDASRSGGTLTVTGTDVTISADGGTIGPFRYVWLFNDTPSSPADPLIGYWDIGEEITLADGESHTTDFDPSGSDVLFTIALS